MISISRRRGQCKDDRFHLALQPALTELGPLIPVQPNPLEWTSIVIEGSSNEEAAQGSERIFALGNCVEM